MFFRNVIDFGSVVLSGLWYFFFFFKQKTSYEMRISDWSSDVCSSDLLGGLHQRQRRDAALRRHVVALPDRTLQAGAGRGVDDAAVDFLTGLGLIAPALHEPAGDAEVAFPMDLDHQIPLVFGQIGRAHV